jgi:hypothetical protein
MAPKASAILSGWRLCSLRCVTAPLVRLAAVKSEAGVSPHTFDHGVDGGTAMFCTPEAFNLSNGHTLFC